LEKLYPLKEKIHYISRQILRGKTLYLNDFESVLIVIDTKHMREKPIERRQIGSKLRDDD